MTGPGTAPTVTLGRDVELGALLALLADAGAGRSCAAVVRGPAGNGKTHLLRAVSERARAQGWTVLTARGVEVETVLAGAGLLSVLGPVREHLDTLPEPMHTALAAALGWGPPATVPGERYLVGAATLELLAAAAASDPVLVVVDDAQWVDDDSLDALAFAARRLGHDRVAVVLGQRSETPLPPRLAGLDVVEVGGLPAAAARELLGPGVADDVAAVLVARTGGNPLALTECRRHLDRAQRAGAAPLPAALPVPEELRRVFVDELAGLPAECWRAVVLTSAAPADDAGTVLAALAAEGLDGEAALVGAGDVLVREEGRLAFRHPLLRSAAWQRASRSERTSAHATVAGVLTDRSARVLHLAEAVSGPDAALAEELAAVAESARDRLGVAAASRAMERAARLTPDVSRRHERLAAATDDAFVAGDTDRARRLAAEVLSSDAGAAPRAHVLLVLGLLEQAHGTLAASRDLLEQAAGLAEGGLLVRVLAELLGVAHLLDDPGGMAGAAERVAASADPDDPEQAMLAAYVQGAAHVVLGRPDLGFPLLRRAIALLEGEPALRDDPRHAVVAAMVPRYLMDPRVALPYAERRIARAREAGALGVLAMVLSVYAAGLAWMGEHVRAHAWAGEAVELLESLDLLVDLGTASEIAALELAFRGRHDEVRHHLDRARRVVAANGFDPMPPHLARTVASCAMAAGDLETVVEVLEDQVARFDGVGPHLEPLGVAPDLVEAYLGLGRDVDARRLVERFAAAQADPPHDAVAALVARCQALVDDDLERSVAAFGRAVALHESGPDRLQAARTRMLLGMRLRRAGRRVEARTHLEVARREFATMDLDLWVGRAASELAATGEHVRPRTGTGDSLTSQETRVALLVARGLTNREVAAALFISPRTVEHHLGAVLRKRGLRSRTELAASFASSPPESGEGAG